MAAFRKGTQASEVNNCADASGSVNCPRAFSYTDGLVLKKRGYFCAFLNGLTWTDSEERP